MGHARPLHATEMIGFDRSHAEVIDPNTRQVWQSIEPCDAKELAGLALPEPLRPVGVGHGAMDEMWFDRSPGASKDGSMEERTIDGRRFGHCARPASPPTKPFGEDGPTEMLVDKYHALRFAAGRRVPVLLMPDAAAFVHVIEGAGVSSIGLDHEPNGELFRKLTGDVSGATMLEGRFKLIHWKGEAKYELFDVKNDPGEMRELSHEMPKSVAQ